MTKINIRKSFIISSAIHIVIIVFVFFLSIKQGKNEKITIIQVESIATEENSRAKQEITQNTRNTPRQNNNKQIERLNNITPPKETLAAKQEITRNNTEKEKRSEPYSAIQSEQKQKSPDETKEYIEVNLSKLREAIVKYRKYPISAIKTGSEGICSVSFRLYPTGDVDEIKIAKSSGFATLDRSSIQTIEDAASEMPKPHKSITLIIPIEYKLN